MFFSPLQPQFSLIPAFKLRESQAVRGVDLGQLCNVVWPGSSVEVVAGGGGGGGYGAVLVFENSIQLIRVQGYGGLTEKWKTFKTDHPLRYSVLKIREYF